MAWWHWLIIAAAFVLLFGAKKLPDAARGVGRSLRILKSEVGAMQDDDAARKESAAANTAAPAPVIPAAPQIVAPTPTPAVIPTEQQRTAG